MKVGIVMGSKSDYPVVQKAEQMLENFGEIGRAHV